ncbi:MAG: hypothetical protein IPM59_07620 [Chloracidobacterium sp.]|nr:hypothetical protein [Chloracidobacterium sp.]
MDDTNTEVRRLQHSYWMSLPEAERFRRCGQLFALAKLAALERAPADLSAEEKKWFVIQEFYGADFVDMVRENND